MHLCPFKRILTVVDILFSIQYIILEGFQIHLVIFRLPSGLMEAENISLMDSHTVHHLCCHLVGCHIGILFLKPHIVPDHILCLEQITVLHILDLQSHGRKVVTVHDKHNVLVIFGQGFRKLLDKLVHLINLVAVILPFIIDSVGLSAGDGDLGVIDHRLLRIIPVALYGYGVNVIRVIGRFQCFHNIFCQVPVSHPVIWIGVILL